MRGSFLAVMILCLAFGGDGQELSKETRARFVEAQEEYLNAMKLSIEQKRNYQTITIKYEKAFMDIYRNRANQTTKKKQVKNAMKKKDKEMNQFLSKEQYRLYIRRQKEIANNYND